MDPERNTVKSSTCASRAFRALNSVVLPAVKSGLASPLPIGAGLVILETTGRVSGQTRQVPLLALRIGNHINVSTVRPSSQWVKNIEADRDVTVWVGGRKHEATAAVGPYGPNMASIRF